MKLIFKAGQTSQRIVVFIPDTSSSTGGGLTGLVFNSASLSWYYWREDTGNANGTSVTIVTATRGTFASGGFIQVDATNLPGYYEIGVPDAVLASGAKWAVMQLKGAANMPQVNIEIELVAVDLFDTVRMGLTALPNAAAEAAGGLYTRGSGAGQINQANNGQVDSNAARLGGTTQTGRDVGASVLLSSGTGTGQLDFTSGVVKANLAQILGTALTETAGLLAGGFKKFFNVASPTGTLNSIPDAVPDASGGLPVTGNRLTAIPTVAAVTTVTNLTNAPTAGDLTATMKTSVTTAATAATPTVTAGTVTDKTGYALSGAGVQAIWDALTSALTTVGSVGKRVADFLTGDAYVRLGAPAGASHAADVAAVKVDTAAVKVQTDKLTFTVANQVDSNVLDWKSATAPAMTGDAFARLGAPAGASVSADVAATKALLPTALAADGSIKASVQSILGTAFTEGAAGRIAAAFKQFFNIATPAATMDHGVLVDTVTTVTNPVTAGTISDKTGYALTAAYDPAKTASQAGDAMALTSGERTTLAAVIWNALTSGMSTVGSIGKRLADDVDATISSRLATAGYTTPPTVGAIADQVWDETAADHVAVGSTGKALADAGGAGTPPTVGQIADGVWDELLSGHAVSGSAGAALTGAGSAGDPWSTAVPGAYGAGTAGKILGDNLNATVSSRLASASYTAPDNAGIAAIKAKTDQLVFTLTNKLDVSIQSAGDFAQAAADKVWSAAARVLTAGTNIVLAKGTGVTGFNDLSAAQVNAEADTALADVGVTATVTGRIDVAVSSRLATAGYTAPDNADVVTILGLVDTEVAAIKLKTDLIPASPAAVGDVPTANANADALLDRAAGVETGWTIRQAMRIMLAAMAGKADGAATTTMHYRDMADTKNRLTATVTPEGNRTSVTRDSS